MSTSNSETLSREESLQKLEALFANSNIPAARPAPKRQSPRSRPNMGGEGERVVFSNPRKSIGRAPSEFRLKLERLRIARNQEELVEAADNFLSAHQLPDDPEILLKVLRHPSEKVLREALGQISSLRMQGRMGSTVLLEDRLRQLEETITEPSTRSYVEGILHQIQKLGDN